MISKQRQRLEYVITDWVTTTLAFLAFNVYRFYHISVVGSQFASVSEYLLSPKMIAEEVLVPLFMLFVYWLSGYYNDPFQRSRLQEFYTTLWSGLLNSLLVYLAMLTNDQIQISSENYAMLGILWALLFALPYTGRILLTTRRLNQLRKKRWKFNVLITGTRDKAAETAHNLAHSLSNLGYIPVAYLLTDSPDCQEFEGRPAIRMEDLEATCRDLHVKQIILALPRVDDSVLLDMLRQLIKLDIPVKITPKLQNYLTSSIRLQDIYGEPFVDITVPYMRESTKNVKRTIDVLLSIVALILIAIPSLYIALRIKLDSKGPVLYRQTRIGRHRKPFTILKFRTMRTDAESNGPQLTTDGDPRVTRIGAVLRKYRIDELPQFWNVLCGEMSLVGPRPEREHFINQILEKAPYYTLLHQVRPGITSWGMVKYGYASSVDQMIERVRYDLLYLSNMSISVDFKILIYTVRTVVLGKGK